MGSAFSARRRPEHLAGVDLELISKRASQTDCKLLNWTLHGLSRLTRISQAPADVVAAPEDARQPTAVLLQYNSSEVA